MSKQLIDQMVDLAEDGFTSKSVWESVLSIGSDVKVNKNTTAELLDGGTASLSAGDVVSVQGVGGGASGADYEVLLSDGRQGTVPYADVVEGMQKEDLTGSVVKVVLTKPLPQGVVDWLQGGYMDYGVELPSTPEADAANAMTFLMKAEDDDMLNSALDVIKKEAGSSFKDSKAATMVDWSKNY